MNGSTVIYTGPNATDWGQIASVPVLVKYLGNLGGRFYFISANNKKIYRTGENFDFDAFSEFYDVGIDYTLMACYIESGTLFVMSNLDYYLKYFDETGTIQVIYVNGYEAAYNPSGITKIGSTWIMKIGTASYYTANDLRSVVWRKIDTDFYLYNRNADPSALIPNALVKFKNNYIMTFMEDFAFLEYTGDHLTGTLTKKTITQGLYSYFGTAVVDYASDSIFVVSNSPYSFGIRRIAPQYDGSGDLVSFTITSLKSDETGGFSSITASPNIYRLADANNYNPDAPRNFFVNTKGEKFKGPNSAGEIEPITDTYNATGFINVYKSATFSVVFEGLGSATWEVSRGTPNVENSGSFCQPYTSPFIIQLTPDEGTSIQSVDGGGVFNPLTNTIEINEAEAVKSYTITVNLINTKRINPAGYFLNQNIDTTEWSNFSENLDTAHIFKIFNVNGLYFEKVTAVEYQGDAFVKFTSETGKVNTYPIMESTLTIENEAERLLINYDEYNTNTYFYNLVTNSTETPLTSLTVNVRTEIETDEHTRAVVSSSQFYEMADGSLVVFGPYVLTFGLLPQYAGGFRLKAPSFNIGAISGETLTVNPREWPSGTVLRFSILSEPNDLDVIFYNMSDEMNALPKTLTNPTTITGTFRGACDVLRPQIRLILPFYPSFNYCYIPTLKRFYFVENLTIEYTNTYLFDLRVDVLESYKNEINAMTALIARNEYEYNPNLVDKLEYFEYYNDVREYKPTMIEGKTLTPVRSIGVTSLSYNYVMNVMNDTGGYFADALIIPESYVLPPVNGAATPSGSENIHVLYAHDIKDIMGQLYANDSLAGFVKSLVVFPFEIPTKSGEGSTHIRIGNQNVSSTTSVPFNVKRLKEEDSMNYIHNAYFRIDRPFNDYRDFEPYSLYELFVPYVGWIKLDANNCLGVELLLTYVVNPADGSASALLTDETSKKMIWSGSCQLGIKIGVSTTNALEIERNRISNGINMAMSTTTAVLGLGLGIATGNPLMIAGATTGLVGAAAKGISSELSNIEKAQAQVSGGLVGLYSPDVVRVRISSHQRLYDDIELENYLKLYGKPLNMYKTIEECKGFTQIGEIHIENMNTATTQEIEEVKELLTVGVILKGQ